MNPNIIVHGVTCALGALATIAYLRECAKVIDLRRQLSDSTAHIDGLRAEVASTDAQLESLKARGNFWKRNAEHAKQDAHAEKVRKNKIGRMFASVTGTTWKCDPDTVEDIRVDSCFGRGVEFQPIGDMAQFTLVLTANDWAAFSGARNWN